MVLNAERNAKIDALAKRHIEEFAAHAKREGDFWLNAKIEEHAERLIEEYSRLLQAEQNSSGNDDDIILKDFFKKLGYATAEKEKEASSSK